VRPGVGESVLTLLHSRQTPAIEVLLGSLLNEITALPPNGSTEPDFDFVLVLDDYYFIGSELVHNGVTFLLDHLPPQMHLVIIGRSDPPLPLARLRWRGESTELRAPDLIAARSKHRPGS
jgi:LuxR family maltose regulon positive regulatory protein